MKDLFILTKKKKGLSNLVAYVLLISMVIALAVLVYGWLKFYADVDDIVECSDDTNLVIYNYNYNCSSGSLTVWLKNKGLFSIEEYVLRVHNDSGADSGLYSLNFSLCSFSDVSSIKPNGMVVVECDVSEYGNVSLVEVQPVVDVNGSMVRCDSYAFQVVECSAGGVVSGCVPSDCGSYDCNAGGTACEFCGDGILLVV